MFIKNIAQSGFGNDIYCNMGNETGGYRVRLEGDLQYNDLQKVIQNTKIITENKIVYDYSLLGPNVLVENCSLLDSIIIGEHAHILGSYMKNCSVLSTHTNSTL